MGSSSEYLHIFAELSFIVGAHVDTYVDYDSSPLNEHTKPYLFFYVMFLYIVQVPELHKPVISMLKFFQRDYNGRHSEPFLAEGGFSSPLPRHQ